MDIGMIRQINIDNEMQASYLDYAMSVIVARALPDARDGLKPVHRRILYAMHDLGLDPDKPYKKSARIVGEVLGKYHPHGDAAVYEAMVRMAQDFSLRYPLVDGQGNFGSIDGDNAAAMRYTEARLASIAEEMLNDIDKDTVDWTDNFDGTLKEPSVLPAALPNLVVNGSTGIAVGMSTSIPPHNLGEVCNALCYLIDNYQRAEEVPIEDLMRFIPGPDFPTGGLIYRYQHENGADGEEQVDVIARAYAGGKGRIVVQAKAHIEDMSRNRSRIVVTELPYQTNKTNLLERIAELVRDGRLEGVTDLRDESDRTGMRICIEMTRTVEPRDVLSELFKLTPLQSTFSISLLALVEGEPRLLSLKRMLLHFLEHRQEVIRRRSEHDLAKARQREHILVGLLRALDILDEVIALIRRSRTADSARQGLIKEFQFTELQAQAILDMQLRRLAALERKRLEDEYKEIVALIKELEELLASPKKVLALIRKNLTELSAKYDDPRRTQIADRVKGTLTTHDVLPDQEVWLSLGADGILGRRLKEGMDAAGARKLGAEAALALTATNTRNDLYLFSAKGQATRVPIHQIPEASGGHYADLSGLTRRDRVAAIFAAPKPQAAAPLEGYLALGTVQGKVKRISLPDLGEQAHTNPQVINLDAGDELVWVDSCAGGGEIMLLTAAGQVIRFPEDDVRAMGLPAGGVAGIRLQAKDRVVAGMCVPAGTIGESMLALMTARGWGKQTLLSEFPVQGRNGQGVLAGKMSERSGRFAGFSLLAGAAAIFVRIGGGHGRLLDASLAPVSSRSSQGKPLFEPGSGEQVRGVQAVAGLPLAAPSPAKRSRGGEPPPGKPSGAAKSAAGVRPARASVAPAIQPSLLPAEEPPSAPARRAAKAEKPAAAATPKAGARGAPSAETAPRTPAAGEAPPAAPSRAPTAKKAATAAAAVAVARTAGKAAAKKPPAARAGSAEASLPAQPPPWEEEPPPVATPKGVAKKAAPATKPVAPAPKAEPAAPKPTTTAKKVETPTPAAAPKAAAKKAAAPAPAAAPPKPAAKSPPAAPPQTIARKRSPAAEKAGADAAAADSARVFSRADLPKLIAVSKDAISSGEADAPTSTGKADAQPAQPPEKPAAPAKKKPPQPA